MTGGIATACLLAAIAVFIDWLIGDPRFPPHPVLLIGRWITWLEGRLYLDEGASSTARQKRRGIALVVFVLLPVAIVSILLIAAASAVHPWAGMAVHVWLVSTTIAAKGLKEAAMAVYNPLKAGDIETARRKTAEIVGRDTHELDEPELTRAAVETVAENTVDGFTAPLLFALLGGAPLALIYRAVNTLDSMVGYNNDRYRHFGWASARLDDALNWIPARLTGILLVLVCLFDRRLSSRRAWRSMRVFARRHPSPNSGFPETAVAGAIGIELGGINRYGDVTSERPRLGWPLKPKQPEHIRLAVALLYRVSYFVFGGLLCAGIAVCLLR